MAQLKFVYSHKTEKGIYEYVKNKYPEKVVGLDINNKPETDLLNARILDVTREWDKREVGFISQLNQTFGVSFSLENVSAMLSRVPVYPYEDNWFAIPMEDINQQLHLICHETIHFVFHRHFEEELLAKFEKTKKSKEIVYAIKEALPEMLNFKQFRPFAGDGVFDTGKADVTEQLVRHIIRRIYQKNRTFSVMDLVNLL